MKIKVYSGIEERSIGADVYPFQIYQITNLEDNEYIALGDFNPKKYKVTSYLDIFQKAKVSKNKKCWTNGRIQITIELPIDLEESRGSTDTLINAKVYPENKQNDEIFLVGVKKYLEIEDSLANIKAIYIFEALHLFSSDNDKEED